MESKRCGICEALEALRGTIKTNATTTQRTITPQGPIINIHKEKMVEYLLDEVVGLHYARSEITQCKETISPCNVQQIYAPLDRGWLQKQKEADGNYKNENQSAADPKIPCDFSESRRGHGIRKDYGSRPSKPRRNFNDIYEDRNNNYPRKDHNHQQQSYCREVRQQEQDNILVEATDARVLIMLSSFSTRGSI